MRAIETVGIVNHQGHLELESPMTEYQNSKVKIIVFVPENDMENEDWLKIVANNPSFQFLNNPEEDIYTLEDGSAVNHER